jgi:guanylate kinase
MTTRAPRKDEIKNKDYFFVTDKEFLEIKKKNGFFEDAVVFGLRYGTPKSFVQEKLTSGKDVLLVIDVQGAMKVRRKAKERAVLIFVPPPSIDELKKRLFGRATDETAVMRKRLQTAKQEMKQKHLYDYVVENKDFGQALGKLTAIIKAERLKRTNQ